MDLRIIIPPNLESSAPRDAIPTKLEALDREGKVQTPESLPETAFGGLTEGQRIAAFSLFQWSGGKLSSFFQLDRAKLLHLVDTLQGQQVFFWANRPTEPIEWNGRELIGVSEFLSQEPSSITPPRESSNTDQNVEARFPLPRQRESFSGNPMIIDGSSHFLTISLPSREHPYYAEIRELLDSSRFRLEPRNRKWWLRDRHQTLNFLGEFWTDLEERYGAEFTDNFRSRTAEIKEASIKASVQEDRNHYRVTLSVQAGRISGQSVRQSINSGCHYVESGQKVFLIKKRSLEKLHALQQSLESSPDAPLLHQGTYNVPFSRAPEIENELVALNPNFKPPSTWRGRSAALRDLSKLISPPLPDSLSKILRPYQTIGVSWLHHLYTHQLGGILADEMGLGKTLQALALISSLKLSDAQSSETKDFPHSKGSKRSLVICPASLVENWRREAEKHCPELCVFVNQGVNRFKNETDLGSTDLVITSYGTLIRDQSIFAVMDFRCVFADEAQHMKNRRTLNAKAILSLESRGRFLLTGTPVENSIRDLMSLLEFILPGGWKGIPRDAKGDDRKWHEKRIQEQATPYILRRSKAHVVPELPEKLEHVVYVEMTPDQRKLYDQTKNQAESELTELEKSGASEGSIRMKTLTQLLRLRQVCCDPRLLESETEPNASAKRSNFFELLEESIDGGHRVLVFSQFVSILTLLRNELEDQEIDYCYLDGATRNRMDVVDRFQNNETIPVFLISLKAGGVGLNLTGADTVIHFDPWWNPAAEAQATDRAHRIGQKRVVTSYKLIVSNSIEEHVLLMQNTKRRLLAEIFEASEANNSKIGLEDLRSLLR